MHTWMHARTHTHTHAHTHARTHTHSHAPPPLPTPPPPTHTHTQGSSSYQLTSAESIRGASRPDGMGGVRLPSERVPGAGLEAVPCTAPLVPLPAFCPPQRSIGRVHASFSGTSGTLSKPAAGSVHIPYVVLIPSQSEDAYAPPPLPPYLEAFPVPEAKVFDTCYHLLQLYCSRDHSLELTLGPSTSTPFQLDYRIRYGNGTKYMAVT